jgi:hypothetical protein
MLSTKIATEIGTTQLQLAFPSRAGSANNSGIFTWLQPATKPATFATSWHRPHQIPLEVELTHE